MASIFLVVGAGMCYLGFAFLQGDETPFPVQILQIMGLMFCLVPFLIILSLIEGRKSSRLPQAFVFDSFSRRLVIAEKGEDPFASSFDPAMLPGYDYAHIAGLTIRHYTTSASSANNTSTIRTHHYVLCVNKKDGSFLDLYHTLQKSEAVRAQETLFAAIGHTFGNADASAKSTRSEPFGGALFGELRSEGRSGVRSRIRRVSTNTGYVYCWKVPARFLSLFLSLVFVGLFGLLLFNFDMQEVAFIRVVACVILAVVALAALRSFVKGILTIGQLRALRITDQHLEIGFVPRIIPQYVGATDAFKLEKTIALSEVSRIQYFYSMESDNTKKSHGLTVLSREQARDFDTLSQLGTPKMSDILDLGRKMVVEKLQSRGSIFLDLPALSARELILFENILEAEIGKRGGKVD